MADSETSVAHSAKTGITNNSIEQNGTKTFQIVNRRFTSFDASILDTLSAYDRAAWVLVGGRSSRMGTDKARAESDGRALALRVADQAAKVCDTVCLVGDPAIYTELGLPVVADSLPRRGPLGGIETALGATVSDANLILACDMPSISESLLEELFVAGGDCAIPRHENGHLEPLCAVYQRRCHRVVVAALDAGIRKVTDGLLFFAQQSLAIRYVRVSDATLFANLNTPEDWRRYHHG